MVMVYLQCVRVLRQQCYHKDVVGTCSVTENHLSDYNEDNSVTV